MTDERRFDVLARVVEIATTSVDASERLQSILGVVQGRLEARLAILFMLDKSKRNIVRASSWPRDIDLEPDLVIPLGDGVMDEVIMRRQPVMISMSKPCSEAYLTDICEPGELVSLLPVCDDSQVYGVLVLVLPQNAVVDDNMFKLLQMIAREIAGTVRNSRLYMEAKRRIAELNVISDLGLAAISTIEVDELLDTVASMCAKLLGASGGLVSIEGSGKIFLPVMDPSPKTARRWSLVSLQRTTTLNWDSRRFSRNATALVKAKMPAGTGFACTFPSRGPTTATCACSTRWPWPRAQRPAST